MNKKALLLILFSSLLAPVVVFAQAGQGPIENIVGNVVNVVIFVAGGIVVIIWAVTGVLFLSSQGDSGRLTTAKSALFAAIAGTILVILALSAKAIIGNIIFSGI